MKKVPDDMSYTCPWGQVLFLAFEHDHYSFSPVNPISPFFFSDGAINWGIASKTALNCMRHWGQVLFCAKFNMQCTKQDLTPFIYS